MSEPKLGMSYSEVAKRIKRIQSNPKMQPDYKRNLVSSLKRQCRLAEGESAVIALERECASSSQQGSSLTGAGNKQVGWGEGKKLGPGTWYWGGGKWEKGRM